MPTVSPIVKSKIHPVLLPYYKKLIDDYGHRSATKIESDMSESENFAYAQAKDYSARWKAKIEKDRKAGREPADFLEYAKRKRWPMIPPDVADIVDDIKADPTVIKDIADLLAKSDVYQENLKNIIEEEKELSVDKVISEIEKDPTILSDVARVISTSSEFQQNLENTIHPASQSPTVPSAPTVPFAPTVPSAPIPPTAPIAPSVPKTSRTSKGKKDINPIVWGDINDPDYLDPNELTENEKIYAQKYRRARNASPEETKEMIRKIREVTGAKYLRKMRIRKAEDTGLGYMIEDLKNSITQSLDCSRCGRPYSEHQQYAPQQYAPQQYAPQQFAPQQFAPQQIPQYAQQESVQQEKKKWEPVVTAQPIKKPIKEAPQQINIKPVTNVEKSEKAEKYQKAYVEGEKKLMANLLRDEKKLKEALDVARGKNDPMGMLPLEIKVKKILKWKREHSPEEYVELLAFADPDPDEPDVKGSGRRRQIRYTNKYDLMRLLLRYT